jgi:hypothetical protein
MTDADSVAEGLRSLPQVQVNNEIVRTALASALEKLSDRNLEAVLAKAATEKPEVLIGAAAESLGRSAEPVVALRLAREALEKAAGGTLRLQLLAHEVDDILRRFGAESATIERGGE